MALLHVQFELMSDPETIPLSEYCPLHEADVDEAIKIRLRDRAAQLVYESWPPVEWHEIAEVLEAEMGVSRDTAYFAVECIGRISRKYCANCDLGSKESGDFTLVPR